MKKIIAIQSNNLKTINPLTDTSLQLAIEAQKRGLLNIEAIRMDVNNLKLDNQFDRLNLNISL